jgi:hypothetical protein
MMRKPLTGLVALTFAGALMSTGVASAATTLGTTTIPAGASLDPCGGGRVVAQATSDPSTPYSPPGTGTITQWQTNTTGDLPGDPITFVVLRPAGGSAFSVIGADARTIPNPLPAGNVATYALASPIAVAAGDTLGLLASGITPNCYFDGGATPLTDTLMQLTSGSTVAVGQQLGFAGGNSPPGYTMNLAANFVPTPPHKKKCKKKKKHRSAESAKKKKCKKKKKR